MGSMEGKAGLVTGAASGIGRATAVRAAAEGASVLVSDLESAREGGEETVALIRKDGGTAEFQVCDVARPEDHDALVAAVLDRWGTLDFAHNNAGVGGGGKLLADIPDEEFDRVIAINLRGVFLGMKRQIKAMLAGGGGSIVNTASNAGLRGVKRLSPYTAAKHGLVGLTKNAAVEYAEDLIRVNAVAPGTIMTGFARGATPERLAEIMKPQALQRIGEPEEVAAAVVWLMSDDASFVTGVTLPVDAGSVAGW